jgi:hypothetical protein
VFEILLNLLRTFGKGLRERFCFAFQFFLISGRQAGVDSKFPVSPLVHPNTISGTLDALEARFDIAVIYTSLYRPLAEEKATSWLSKHFTYWYLETNGFGRVLQEGDL